MKVKELIKKLQQANPEEIVEVVISQSNKVYPILYCQIYENKYKHLQSNGKRHRIEISLPSDDNFRTILVERKIHKYK